MTTSQLCISIRSATVSALYPVFIHSRIALASPSGFSRRACRAVRVVWCPRTTPSWNCRSNTDGPHRGEQTGRAIRRECLTLQQQLILLSSKPTAARWAFFSVLASRGAAVLIGVGVAIQFADMTRQYQTGAAQASGHPFLVTRAPQVGFPGSGASLMPSRSWGKRSGGRSSVSRRVDHVDCRSSGAYKRRGQSSRLVINEAG